MCGKPGKGRHGGAILQSPCLSVRPSVCASVHTFVTDISASTGRNDFIFDICLSVTMISIDNIMFDTPHVLTACMLFHGDNKLHFSEMMMMSALYWTNMLSWLASSVVDCGFERRRVEPKTKNVVFCFSAKNAVLIIRIKS
jgi:hypothetical protein